MTLRIAHVTASPFFSGVERLILEIGRSHQHTKGAEQIFASFPEEGRAGPFLHEIEQAGLTAYLFQNDMPHLVAATWEFIRLLRQHHIQILCAHGHKPRMLGWFAAKYLRIPIIGISHGWTGEDRKVQLYDRMDKWMHRRMDHIVCVSQGQADKVIRYGTPAGRVSVIYNAVRMDRFNVPSDSSYRHQLESFFPNKPKRIIGAAGRLSPEKGYDILITAAGKLLKSGLEIGVVLFGEGALREPLQKQIDDAGIAVVLPGFTEHLDQYMPHFDLFVQSSHTEGLPSVLLEAMSARTAVVATEVGGTGELVANGSTGLLVPPNDPDALAEAMRKVLTDDTLRQTMGENGHQRVDQHFTIEPQAEAYWELYRRLLRMPLQ
jgi:glycosyltransferase involved in cell wall biosynthesis